ncbi:hypothetical protein ABW21_db0209389 [Orbilia brochopaga]|nr:hypothetical protein ABW21_db0209389 [Drechslerella brochopaga]
MSNSTSLAQLPTPIPDTTQRQIQHTVKLVARKLTKDSWPSWYKPDAGSDDPYSSKWQYRLEYQGRISSTRVIRDPFADTENAEEDLRWLLEDHAVKQPNWLKKASTVSKAIKEYGGSLYNDIRHSLEDVVLGNYQLRRQNDGLHRMAICLLIAGENDDNSIHALHWEALELQPDLDINIVRSIYPMTTFSKETDAKAGTIDEMAIDAVDEDGKMDLDIENFDSGVLSSSELKFDTHIDLSTTLNIPEVESTGRISRSPLRVLFCTARSAGLPNVDIEYRVIARAVHDALSSLIASRQIQMDFVRPGTWEALQSALNSKPTGYYHLVHFDVHGKVTKKRAFIKLVSREDPTELERRDAVELAHLLAERGISLVILNACESAKSASDLESNLAAVLVQNGIKCAIGMSFKLLVSSASTLVPLLYEQLLQNRGAVTLAVHNTRRALVRDTKRKGTLGTVVSLPDAILPVLYQRVDQSEISLWPNLFPVSDTPELARAATFPSTLRGEASAIIGRDLDLLRIENALTAESHVIELVGVPGSGRTSFLQFASSWWESTGLVDDVVWLGEKDWAEVEEESPDLVILGDSFIAAIQHQLELRPTPREDDISPDPASITSPSRRGLLILDDISSRLTSLDTECKDRMFEVLQNQDFYYVVLVTDIRDGCTEPCQFIYCHYHCQYRLNYFGTCYQQRHEAQPEPRSILETSVDDASNLSEMLYGIFNTGFPEMTAATYIRFLRHPFVKRVRALFEIFGADNDSAGLLFLCIGCSTLRIKRDPNNLIKAFLVSEFMSDSRVQESMNIDPDIAAVASDDMISQIQELYQMRKYMDLYPMYRDIYYSIMSRLESEGLIWQSVEGYFQVHPLLKTSSLAIALMEFGSEAMIEINDIFREQYRLVSKNWELGDLLALWSAKSFINVPKESPRHVLSTDLANCIAVLHKPLFTRADGSNEWLKSFPWMLLIHTMVYVCASVDARPTQATDSFVETLAPAFQAQWDRSKSSWPGILKQDSGSSKYEFLNPKSDPDVWIGPVTAALVALLRLKLHLNIPAITKVLSGQTNELYNELIASTAGLDFDDYPMMIELLRGKYYVVGFDTGEEAMRLEHLDNQYQRMQDNLKKHFSSGLSSKLCNAYDAGIIRGVERITRKMLRAVPELREGFPTTTEYSAWAQKRGLELNIERIMEEPILPLELDGLDPGADNTEVLIPNQTELMLLDSGIESERSGQTGTEAMHPERDQWYWLIVYAHRSMQSNKMEEAAAAFRKSRLHLEQAQPTIFDKSIEMTVARSHAFPHFNLESTALWTLGRMKEARQIQLDMRDILGPIEEEPPLPVTISENAQLLLLAASDHNLLTLRSLLKTQTPNVQDPTNLRTPLHVAILACEGLSNGGANGATNGHTNGDSASSNTASNGLNLPPIAKATKTLELLLQNGAIWNALDANNETPGCIAYRLGLMPLYEIMVDAGVRAELLFGRLDGYVALDDDDDDDEEVVDAEEENDGGVIEVPEGNDEKTALDKAGEEAMPVTSEEYLASKLEIDDDRILDEDKNGVMMSWEAEIMSKTASLLIPTPTPARVLNIGYGLGIIDSLFQSHSPSPSAHHIVEAHPQVLEKLRSSPIASRPGITIHEGRWQDILPKLEDQGLVFDAIYFDTFAEDYSQLKLFFTEHVITLLDSDGRFGFFNGLGADRQIAYDVYRKVVEIDLLEAGLDTEWTEIPVDRGGMDGKGGWKGVRRKYWDLERYILPVCKFMG